MGDENVAKSSDQCLESFAFQKHCAKVRARELSGLLACPICKKLCKDAITINRCNHSFCQKCINQKIESAGGLKCCPYCYEDLSNYSPDQYLRRDETLRSIIEKMLIKNTERDKHVKKPYQLITRGFESTTAPTNEKEVRAILKKKKRTRKAGKFRKQGKGKKPIKHHENCTRKKDNKKIVSKGYTSDKMDENERENEDVGLNKFQSFWFHLSPQKDKKEHSYPKLSRSYIHVKNANLSLSASVIHKYLTKKLNLKNEDEVEVCCFGEPLIKALTLRDIYNIWLECITKAPPNYSCSINFEGLNAKKIVMQLTYRKNLKDEAHPSTLNFQ